MIMNNSPWLFEKLFEIITVQTTILKQSNKEPKTIFFFVDVAFDEQGKASIHQILHEQHAELCQLVQQTSTNGRCKHVQRDRAANVAQ